MSQSLIDELASPAGYQRLHHLCKAGHYVVVPAFEVLLDKSISADQTSKDIQLHTALRRARALVQQSKLQLLQALPQGWMAPFGFWRNFTNGHGPTDFTRYVSTQACIRPSASGSQRHMSHPCPHFALHREREGKALRVRCNFECIFNISVGGLYEFEIRISRKFLEMTKSSRSLHPRFHRGHDRN